MVSVSPMSEKIMTGWGKINYTNESKSTTTVQSFVRNPCNFFKLILNKV